jgi:hypothetical protein
MLQALHLEVLAQYLTFWLKRLPITQLMEMLVEAISP